MRSLFDWWCAEPVVGRVGLGIVAAFFLCDDTYHAITCLRPASCEYMIERDITVTVLCVSCL